MATLSQIEGRKESTDTDTGARDGGCEVGELILLCVRWMAMYEPTYIIYREPTYLEPNQEQETRRYEA